jgi:arylsulfatase A-like enzyme
VYGAILGFLAVGGWAAFSVHDLGAVLQQIGSESSWIVAAASAVVVLLVVVAAGVSGAALGSLWQSRLRRTAIGFAIVLNLAFLPVVASYPLTDEKGAVYQPHRGVPRVAGEQSVVLITLDTVRADRVGAYAPGSGSTASLTPAIDALARQGILFEQAISSSPWTLPALASVMTGESPRQHGAGWLLRSRDPLARSALRSGPTLARVMQAHGYFTQAFVTNPFVSVQYGMEQGFDGYEHLTLEAETLKGMGKTPVVRAFTMAFPELGFSDRGEAVTARAVRWLRRHRDERFLLWLHYIDPHAPYVDSEDGPGTSFRGDTLLNERRAGFSVKHVDIARIRSGEIHLSAAERQELIALYDREVRYVDEQVGRVIAELDRLDIAEETLVVVLSDHGEEFWEHGGVEHGHTLYDELVRVPFVLRGPGLAKGARVSGVVRLIDVAPTILDLLGLPPLIGARGVSLLSRLRGEHEEPLVAVSESLLFAEEQTAVRTDRSKYVRWADGREEFYDLLTDPSEQRSTAACGDLAPVHALFSQAVDGVSGTILTSSVVPDPRVHAGLRSLGYVH